MIRLGINNNTTTQGNSMTRYYYHPHSDKELPVTYHYGLTRKVWILDTARHLPMAVRLIDTDEDCLLFESEQACSSYYDCKVVSC